MCAPSIITVTSRFIGPSAILGAAPPVAASATSRSATTRCNRLRTLAWLDGEQGSNADKGRPASRNECRAPSSPCRRLNSGVHLSGKSFERSENDRSLKPIASTQAHNFSRGTLTVTVPNNVWSVRVRRSRIRRILKQSQQTRAHVTCSSIWLCTMRRRGSARRAFASSRRKPTSSASRPVTRRHIAPDLVGLGFTPSGKCFQPDRPLHDPSPPSVGSTFHLSLGQPRFFPLPLRFRDTVVATFQPTSAAIDSLRVASPRSVSWKRRDLETERVH
jgi:hypothetical protein